MKRMKINEGKKKNYNDPSLKKLVVWNLLVLLSVIWICLSADTNETLSPSLWDSLPPWHISSTGEKGAPWKQRCSQVNTFLFFSIHTQSLEKENIYSNSSIPGQELPCCPRSGILSDVLLLAPCTNPVKTAEIAVCSRLKLLQCFAFPVVKTSSNRLTFKESCEQ